MKKLLVNLGNWKEGKVFTEAKRTLLEIPDIVWNNIEIFSNITLTYAYLFGKVGACLPSVGANKPTTDKFKAYVKFYGLALYFNNINAIEFDNFIFENRWVYHHDNENEGYIITGKVGNFEIKKQIGVDQCGIIFKSENAAIQAFDLMGDSINDLSI